MTAYPSNELTPGELVQQHVNQLCAKLRSMTNPPARMDQSQEGIERWRNIRD